MVEQTISTFGRLDAAFNNAGVQSPAVETADASGFGSLADIEIVIRDVCFAPKSGHSSAR